MFYFSMSGYVIRYAKTNTGRLIWKDFLIWESVMSLVWVIIEVFQFSVLWVKKCFDSPQIWVSLRRGRVLIYVLLDLHYGERNIWQCNCLILNFIEQTRERAGSIVHPSHRTVDQLYIDARLHFFWVFQMFEIRFLLDFDMLFS